MAAIPNGAALGVGIATAIPVAVGGAAEAYRNYKREKSINTAPSEHRSSSNNAARPSSPGIEASSPPLRNSLPSAAAPPIDMPSSSANSFPSLSNADSTREGNLPRISHSQASGVEISIPGPAGVIVAVGYLIWSLFTSREAAGNEEHLAEGHQQQDGTRSDGQTTDRSSTCGVDGGPDGEEPPSDDEKLAKAAVGLRVTTTQLRKILKEKVKDTENGGNLTERAKIMYRKMLEKMRPPSQRVWEDTEFRIDPDQVVSSRKGFRSWNLQVNKGAKSEFAKNLRKQIGGQHRKVVWGRWNYESPPGY